MPPRIEIVAKFTFHSCIQFGATCHSHTIDASPMTIGTAALCNALFLKAPPASKKYSHTNPES